MWDEEHVDALRKRIRARAAEKRISLFAAATELGNETWDNDEEELLQLWRLELAPRKHSRNPVKRVSMYLARRHPWLMVISGALVGIGLGGRSASAGLSQLYPLAAIAALWLIGHYDIVYDMNYTFRPFPAHLDYRLRSCVHGLSRTP